MTFIRIALIALFIMSVPTLSGRAAAQTPGANTQPVFFSAIPDLPIMPGLRELPDQTVVFDKAQGRIVESVAFIESQFEEEVRRYYQTTLPQLGWVAAGDLDYVRAEERLHLSFERIEDERFLHVRIAPQ
ncbi:MAG: hypothetical protein KDJ35_08310 [Alphaproteobacteria bacterium]|nr:hypothetical protein [Alphaproteobacteria bacterium]